MTGITQSTASFKKDPLEAWTVALVTQVELKKILGQLSAEDPRRPRSRELARRLRELRLTARRAAQALFEEQIERVQALDRAGKNEEALRQRNSLLDQLDQRIPRIRGDEEAARWFDLLRRSIRSPESPPR